MTTSPVLPAYVSLGAQIAVYPVHVPIDASRSHKVCCPSTIGHLHLMLLLLSQSTELMPLTEHTIPIYAYLCTSH